MRVWDPIESSVLGKEYLSSVSRGAKLDISNIVTSKVIDSEASHSHENDYEYYYIINGSVDLVVDGEEVRVEKEQVLEVEPGETHEVVNVTKDTRYIVIRTSLSPSAKPL